MAEEKKTAINEEEAVEQEINLDELEQVTGGALRNVQYTKTIDISEDTKRKI